MNMRKFKLIVLSLSLLIASCGFHAQQPLKFPFNNHALSIKPYYPREQFYFSLKQHLNAHNIQIKENQAYELEVLSMNIEETPAAYGVDGQVHRTRIVLNLNVALNAPYIEKYSATNISVVRNHTNNPNDALSSAAEKQVIIHEMYEDAARRVLYYLTSFNKDADSTQ